EYARAVLAWPAGSVLRRQDGAPSDQYARRPPAESSPTVATPPVKPARTGATPPMLALEFHNGLGGFAADGTEYVVVLGDEQWSPAPWINVLAHSRFGFCVSESGSGFSWSENSRE